MQLIKKASGKTVIKMSRQEWLKIGEMANWLQKLSASILHVSPRYRGKDSGTAGAKPFTIQDNERIFGNQDNNNITAFPENWDELNVAEKAKYVARQVMNGRLRFPYQIDQEIKRIFEYKPQLFFSPIFKCLNDTAKLPNFTRDWMDKQIKNKTLPHELMALIQHSLSKFPENRRTLDMLYEDYPARSVNINRR